MRKDVSIPPRTERGTKSVTRISPKDMIPPPPMPWIERPTNIIVKFVATAATTDPTKKNKIDARTNFEISAYEFLSTEVGAYFFASEYMAETCNDWLEYSRSH